MTFPATLITLTNSRALALLSCRDDATRKVLTLDHTDLLPARFVTYQVQDKERGERGVGLDGVGRNRPGSLHRGVVGFKRDNGGFARLHQQFHHQTREALSDLKSTPIHTRLTNNPIGLDASSSQRNALVTCGMKAPNVLVLSRMGEARGTCSGRKGPWFSVTR